MFSSHLSWRQQSRLSMYSIPGSGGGQYSKQHSPGARSFAPFEQIKQPARPRTEQCNRNSKTFNLRYTHADMYRNAERQVRSKASKHRALLRQLISRCQRGRRATIVERLAGSYLNEYLFYLLCCATRAYCQMDYLRVHGVGLNLAKEHLIDSY